MEQPLGDINIVCVHVSASPKNEEKKNDKTVDEEEKMRNKCTSWMEAAKDARAMSLNGLISNH